MPKFKKKPVVIEAYQLPMAGEDVRAALETSDDLAFAVRLSNILEQLRLRLVYYRPEAKLYGMAPLPIELIEADLKCRVGVPALREGIALLNGIARSRKDLLPEGCSIETAPFQ